MSSLLVQVKTIINTTLKGLVKTWNGRKGDVVMTEADVQATVAPNNFIIGVGVTRIIASATPPVDPQSGDIWIDTSQP